MADIIDFISLWNSRQMGGFQDSFKQANVANLPNLSNVSWPMKESLHLIGGLLGHVCQYDLFKWIQILNTSNVCHKKLNSFGFV